jgi:hypothetical protein
LVIAAAKIKDELPATPLHQEVQTDLASLASV